MEDLCFAMCSPPVAPYLWVGLLYAIIRGPGKTLEWAVVRHLRNRLCISVSIRDYYDAISLFIGCALVASLVFCKSVQSRRA